MKPTVIDPKTTPRAEAYALWMNALNPMVTFFKTLDITPLVRFSRKRGLKFNMLLCWCIGKAAGWIKEFYTLPVGRELLHYDSIAVNAIVKKTKPERSVPAMCRFPPALRSSMPTNGHAYSPFPIDQVWGFRE